MINKFFISVFIIFIFASYSFAAPNYEGTEPIVVDYDYNHKLYQKLYSDFRKKYPVVLIKDTPNEKAYNDTSPMGALQKEVMEPYILQKKNYDELPHYQYGKRIK